jgi:hypothetical protein
LPVGRFTGWVSAEPNFSNWLVGLPETEVVLN